MDTIYADLERVFRIYERRDLLLTADLVFHSCLQFDFQGERIVRGWMEALIIGDSRTGKTTVVNRMVRHYRAGEFGTGENTSLAGLVGGLHQVGTTWALQWGKIPLNDRRLYVTDEAGNLPLESIARMSSMRSSGVAELTKIHTERTHARTRQIWISNPRSPQPLSSFAQGVTAVKELIGAPEDIARFDLVCTAASGDVMLSTINASREAEEPQTFTSLLCHHRVMWAWSREPEHIQWMPNAEAEVLRLATEQGQKYKYTTEIPLVEPNEQRIKLARLAIGVALLFVSTGDGENVLVYPHHVQFAAAFLERLYNKPSLNFAEYAAAKHRTFEITNPERVRVLVDAHAPAARLLLETTYHSQRDLAEILSISDRDTLRTAMTTLRESGFLGRGRGSLYAITPAGIAWLRQHLGMGPTNNAQLSVTAVSVEPEW